MPVLMSKSQAIEVARAIRRIDGPGLVRIGVRSGQLYVERTLHGEAQLILELAAPLLPDEIARDE